MSTVEFRTSRPSGSGRERASPALEPGNRIVAQVREHAGENVYRLAVGGREFLAESDTELRDGAVLRLEVRSTSPRLVVSVLREVPAAATATATATATSRGGDASALSGVALNRVLDAISGSLSADAFDRMQSILDAARGLIVPNERTLLIARLFAENAIVPPPQTIANMEAAIFGTATTTTEPVPPRGAVAAALEASPSSDALSTLVAARSFGSVIDPSASSASSASSADSGEPPVWTESGIGTAFNAVADAVSPFAAQGARGEAAALPAIFLAAMTRPEVLRDVLETQERSAIEMVLANRPELAGIDRALRLLDTIQRESASGEPRGSSPSGGGAAGRLVETIDALASASARDEEARALTIVRAETAPTEDGEGLAPSKSESEALAHSLTRLSASGEWTELRELLLRYEALILERDPELAAFRDLWRASSHEGGRRESFDVLNALGRFVEQPFYYSEFVVPVGEGWTPLKFYTRFRRQKRMGAPKKVERIIVDLDLQYLNRIVGDISVNGKSLTAVFRLDDARARALIDRNRWRLESALSEAGFVAATSVGALRNFRHPILEAETARGERAPESGWVDVTA